MARGVNKVILIGNLGEEPAFRTTNSNTAVVNISMVTNEVRRNIETGQTTELAEWHRVVMWGKLAEIAHQWLHKGSQIYIEGKLRTRSYTDKQGTKRTVTEIVADEMQMLGGPKAPASGAGFGSSYDRIPDTYNAQPARQTEAYPQGDYSAYPSSSAGNQQFASASPQSSFAPQTQGGYGSQVQGGYGSQVQGGYGSQASQSDYAPVTPVEPQIHNDVVTNTVDGDSSTDDDLPF